MADLGGSASGSAVSGMGKAAEIILRIIEMAMRRAENAPRVKLDKLRLSEQEREIELRELRESFQFKKGLVDYFDLKRSGLELNVESFKLTAKEFDKFNELMTREGLIYSGVVMTDNGEMDVKSIVEELRKDESKSADFTLVFRKADMESIAEVWKRWGKELQQENIDDRIEDIESNPDISDADKAEAIEMLKKAKQENKESFGKEMNDKTVGSIVDRIVKGEKSDELSLSEALNSYTGRKIDEDEYTIVVDANDPSRYIKCHGHQEVFNDKEYVKTQYDVFVDNQCVYSTHDGKFEGRPANYWEEEKAKIREYGGFSDSLFKFPSYEVYQRWTEHVQEQNENELSFIKKEGQDYDVAVAGLEKWYADNNIQYVDGVVVNKETGEAIEFSDDMSNDEKLTYAEAIVVGKQIESYKEMAGIQDELVFKMGEIKAYEEGTPEHYQALAELDVIQRKLDSVAKEGQELVNDRVIINAAQDTQKTYKEMEQSRNNPEREDSRRSERVDEKEEKRYKMQEVKEKIEEHRTAEEAKRAEVEGRDGLGDKVQDALPKPKASMGRDDR